MSLSPVKTDINVLLSETFYEQRYLAQSRQIDYQLSLPRISLTTAINRQVFRQLFSGLIQHAFQHTHSRAAVELLPFRSDDCTFSIAIRTDSGGIWQKAVDHIFEQTIQRSVHHLEKDPIETCKLPFGKNVQNYETRVSSDVQGDTLHVTVAMLAEESSKMLVESESDRSWISRDDVFCTTDKPILLLVENNKEMLAHLYKDLKTTYNILHAKHGKEALDILRKHDVQLLITEIAMPVMDGIDLCLQVKANMLYSHIPVIFLLEQDVVAYKMQGLLSGADAYVEKPFSAVLLMAQIKNLLANRRILQNYMSHTLQAEASTTKGQKDFMKKLHLIIHTYASDINLTVDELAKRMNMSRPTLYRKVKQHSAQTPNELIHVAKLKKAAELLAKKQYNITEVAHMVGYSGQSNFSRDFHKHFGAPPSIYSMSLDKQHHVA